MIRALNSWLEAGATQCKIGGKKSVIGGTKYFVQHADQGIDTPLPAFFPALLTHLTGTCGTIWTEVAKARILVACRSPETLSKGGHRIYKVRPEGLEVRVEAHDFELIVYYGGCQVWMGKGTTNET